jgi:uncharacterized protein YjlB
VTGSGDTKGRQAAKLQLFTVEEVLLAYGRVALEIVGAAGRPLPIVGVQVLLIEEPIIDPRMRQDPDFGDAQAYGGGHAQDPFEMVIERG